MITHIKKTKTLIPKIVATLCMLCITTLAVAPKARAYDITTPVQPTGRAWSADGTRWWTTFNPDTGGYYTSTASNTRAIYLNKNSVPNKRLAGSHILNAIETTTVNAVYGKYYLIKINYTFQNKSTSSTYPSVVRIVTSGQPAYTLMSVSTEYVPCTQWAPELEVTNPYQPQNYVNACTWGGVIYNIIVQARDTGNFPIQLGLSNTDMFRMYIAEYPADTALNVGTISIEDIMEFDKVDFGSNVANEINQQQTDAGQQAQGDGNTAGNTSQSDVTQGTQSLLSALTGFVGVISNASPTNCNINGNMGAVNLGTLNFCRDNPPAIVTIIGTLLLIGVTIPIVIWTVKKIISMFRSFTDG